MELLLVFEEKMNSHHEKMIASQEWTIAKMDAWLAWQKEMTACQEATDACLESKEPSSLEIESVAEHEKVPKKEATVPPVGAMKKWHRGQHLATAN
jgi:hypothetical protein